MAVITPQSAVRDLLAMGLTKGEIGQIIGTSPRYVRQIEHQEKGPATGQKFLGALRTALSRARGQVKRTGKPNVPRLITHVEKPEKRKAAAAPAKPTKAVRHAFTTDGTGWSVTSLGRDAVKSGRGTKVAADVLAAHINEGRAVEFTVTFKAGRNGSGDGFAVSGGGKSDGPAPGGAEEVMTGIARRGRPKKPGKGQLVTANIVFHDLEAVASALAGGDLVGFVVGRMLQWGMISAPDGPDDAMARVVAIQMKTFTPR